MAGLLYVWSAIDFGRLISLLSFHSTLLTDYMHPSAGECSPPSSGGEIRIRFCKNRRGSHNDQRVTLPDHDIKMDRGLRRFENHSMCSCFAATVVLLPAGGTREFSFITLVQFLPVILPECRDVDFVRLP